MIITQITKFTKILCHENLELCGSRHSAAISRNSPVLSTTTRYYRLYLHLHYDYYWPNWAVLSVNSYLFKFNTPGQQYWNQQVWYPLPNFNQLVLMQHSENEPWIIITALYAIHFVNDKLLMTSYNANINFSDAFWGSCEYCLLSSDLAGL